MTFAFPWALLGLVAVAAAAVVALLRPARRRLIVPSLRPWSAETTRGRSAAMRRSRRAVLSWLLLLLGAVSAVLAAARPVLHTQPPRRHIAVAIVKSAELDSPSAAEALNRSTAELLSRLSADDRVQILLPPIAGGATEPLSPSQARSRIEELPTLPSRADELKPDDPTPPFEHVVVFAPAGQGGEAAGPRRTVIELPATACDVNIESAAAEVTGNADAQLFVAVGNHTGTRRSVGLSVTTVEAGQTRPTMSQTLDIPAGEARLVVLELSAADGIAVSVDASDRYAWCTRAYLARRRRGTTGVALLGRDEPALRRLIAAADWLEQVAEAQDADVAVAVGARPPEDKPALVVAPPSPPPGCEAGEPLEHVRLDEADVNADDPIMRHVDLQGVSVRRLRPWVEAPRRYTPLVSVDGGAVVLRDAPAPLPQPRRVYVAFDLDTDNTNFTLSEAFVLFAAGAMEYLAGEPSPGDDYVSQTPLQVGSGANWTAVLGGGEHSSGLPLPGLYADEDGTLHAVSLTGTQPRLPHRDPVAAAGEVPLPEAAPAEQAHELWRVGALAAALLWLGGWALRRDAL